MNVSLTQVLEIYVKKNVEGGQYNSASEMIRESLQLRRNHNQMKIAAIEKFLITPSLIAS